MVLNEETQKAIMDACLDDSTKIINYLKAQEQKQKPYNLAVLIFTIVSATGAVVAAIVSILQYIQ